MKGILIIVLFLGFCSPFCQAQVTDTKGIFLQADLSWFKKIKEAEPVFKVNVPWCAIGSLHTMPIDNVWIYEGPDQRIVCASAWVAVYRQHLLLNRIWNK